MKTWISGIVLGRADSRALSATGNSADRLAAATGSMITHCATAGLRSGLTAVEDFQTDPADGDFAQRNHRRLVPTGSTSGDAPAVI
jgi:hypothetical protein